MIVEVLYTNHRGEKRWRRIEPIALRFTHSEWHEGEQWILLAWDEEKHAAREFAMSGVEGWRAAGTGDRGERG